MFVPWNKSYDNLDQFSLVPQSCPTLCDPMNRSTPGFPVHHQLPEFTQTHVHRVSDAIQSSHPLSSPSPPAPNDKPRQQIKKKNRYITLPTSLSSQRYGFSSSHVWMWQLDHREVLVLKNWCFELWYWRRLLRAPLIAKRSIQSILKEINPEYSLEGLMLKLNLQYSGNLLEEPTHWKVPWCWESLRTGREDDKGWDVWMASLTQWAWVWAISERWWSTEKPDILQSIGTALLTCAAHREWDITEWLKNNNKGSSLGRKPQKKEKFSRK